MLPETRMSEIFKSGKIGIRLSYKKIISIVMCVAMILSLTAVIVSANYSVGYVVTVDGNSVGVVASVDDYNTIVDEVKTEVKNDFDTDISVSDDATFSMTIVPKEVCNNTDGVKDQIKAAAPELIECASIAIDGIEPVYVESIETAYKVLSDFNYDKLNEELERESLLQEYIEAYISAIDGEVTEDMKDNTHNLSVSFNKNVIVETAYVPQESIISYDDAYSFVNGDYRVLEDYTVNTNDSLSEIAKEFEMTLAEIAELNPLSYNYGINPDDVIKVNAKKQVLSLLITSDITYDEDIAFDTTIDYVDTMYKDESEVIVAGEVGTKTVFATVNMVDGEEVSREIHSQIVSREPVTQVEIHGTKKRPTTSSGRFIHPYPDYHILSATFGSYRGHTGIDFAGPVGSDVLASDGGVVSETGWRGGYGKCILITHDNGMQTLYAHLNSIDVSVGSRVAQGQVIGGVGNTGNSTGPHLHFEIRINGKAVNPQNYIRA